MSQPLPATWDTEAPVRLKAGFTLCGCGCGRPVRGKYALGHKPDLRSYRNRGGKRLHVLRAERALGKPLPPKAVVHHADGSKADDAPLVICENQGYHRLLHARMRVVRAGGNPNTEAVCGHCRSVKLLTEFGTDPTNLGTGRYRWCRACVNVRNKRQYAARQAARDPVMADLHLANAVHAAVNAISGTVSVTALNPVSHSIHKVCSDRVEAEDAVYDQRRGAAIARAALGEGRN